MPDPLSDALAALRITTTLYAVADLHGPWGVGFPAGPGAYLHLVGGAGCWLDTGPAPGAAPVWLAPGDAVLLPHGTAHRLTAQPGGAVRTRFDPLTWTPHRLVPVEPGGAGPATELVCGAVHIAAPASHPVLAPLPVVVHVDAPAPGARELRLTAELLRAETRDRRPGADAALARLGDVLVVQLLRIWAAGQPAGRGGWLVALTDPQIGVAVAAMHADPGAPWTVASLAAVAGTSRSRFAQRFAELVGVPPLAYLTRWRLTRAAALLAEPHATVREVARRTGFGSEPAFTRAFTRHHGTPPGRYRRRALDPAAPAGVSPPG